MENESTIKCSKCPSGYIHNLSVIHLYWCMYYRAFKIFVPNLIVEDMIHFSVFLTLFIFLVLLHEKIKYVYNYCEVRQLKDYIRIIRWTLLTIPIYYHIMHYQYIFEFDCTIFFSSEMVILIFCILRPELKIFPV